MIDYNQFLEQMLHIAEERDLIIKKYCDEICSYCENHVDCKGKNCKAYIEGEQGFINDKPVDFHWSCEDFNYGTCPMMENTPCNGCFERDYDGFRYIDDGMDIRDGIEQIRALIQNGQSAIDTNRRLAKIVEERAGL